MQSTYFLGGLISMGGGLFAFAWMLLIGLLHLVLGASVLGDATKRIETDKNSLFLVGPFVWGFIALAFGIAGLGIYWLIHYSSFKESK